MLTLSESDNKLIAEIERIKTDEAIDEIFKISQISWNSPFSRDDIEEWLQNFSGEAIGSSAAERTMALWLLSSFVYFTIDDVREFSRFLFSEYIHSKLVEYQSEGKFQALSVSERISHILEATLFLSLGNDSESGSNVLYYFRQVNGLDKSVFQKQMDKKYENIVFVDDVTISGTQALTYICQMKNSIKNEKIYFLTFLASDVAIDELKHIEVQTLCGNLITEREKCFSSSSYVFESENRKRYLDLTARMCQYYGSIITEGHPEAEGYPLGFDQAQSLFCFFYNTPDNTLPIFWCDRNGWKPLFKRYEKYSNRNEVPINDVFYV